jgi:hypothetical protein
MKFDVKERVILLQLMPKEADYITYKIVENLKHEFGFSDKEIEEYEIKPNQGQIVWNPEKVELKEIEIGKTAEKIITDALKNLDKEKKITGDTISLYERFVLKEE